jgi:hypothetical protein
MAGIADRFFPPVLTFTAVTLDIQDPFAYSQKRTPFLFMT